MPINNNVCPNCGQMLAIPVKREINAALYAFALIAAIASLLLKILYYILYVGRFSYSVSELFALLDFFGGSNSTVIYMIADVATMVLIVVGFAMLKKQPKVLAVATIISELAAFGVNVINIIQMQNMFSAYTLRTFIIQQAFNLIGIAGYVLFVIAIFTQYENRRGLAIAAACCFALGLGRSGLAILTSLRYYIGALSMYGFVLISTLAGIVYYLAFLLAAIGGAASAGKKPDSYIKY
jgi:hypothetical protein